MPENGQSPPRAQESPSAPRSARGPYRTGQARQREILSVATEVFAREGYRGGSLREIAKAIGVTASGILHHFGSKEQLLVAVLKDRDLHSGDTAVQYGQSGNIVDGIRRIVMDNQRQPGLMRLYTTLAAEAVNADHPAHDYFVDRYHMLSGFIVEALQHEGHVPASCQSLEELASLMLSTIDGLQLQWLLNPTFSMIDRFDAMLTAHGLLTRQTLSEVPAIRLDEA